MSKCSVIVCLVLEFLISEVRKIISARDKFYSSSRLVKKRQVNFRPGDKNWRGKVGGDFGRVNFGWK